MGDQVTWVPQVGSSGDDRWNIPGSTCLNGSVDSGAQWPIIVGDTSGFSATPTIAQLNASSGINQIIGLLNRRRLTYDAAFGTSLGSASYLSAGAARIRAANITTIQTSIASLRLIEGWPVFSFTSLSANTVVRGFHIAELRKALSLEGTLTIGGRALGSSNKNWQAWQNIETDNVYPTFTSNVLIETTSGSGTAAGKSAFNGNTHVDRRRLIYAHWMPPWYTVGSEATSTLSTTLGNISTSLEAGFVPNVYYFATDVTPPSAGTFAGGTLLGALTLTAGTQTISPAAPTVAGGSKNSWMYVTDLEYSAGGVGSSSVSASATYSPESPSPFVVPSLILTF